MYQCHAIGITGIGGALLLDAVSIVWCLHLGRSWATYACVFFKEQIRHDAKYGSVPPAAA
jgi:hypothetical protein